MITVRVPIGGDGYDVIIGHGAVVELASMLPTTAKRAVVITQAGIPMTVDPGIPFEVVEIGDGEQFKTLETVESLCRSFGRFGLTRNDVVVAVGGGMVTDVAGFAAATWHRGVAVVHVSSTLLGMVDAAIGGKTGVNLPSVDHSLVDGSSGKNLVGAYWQPKGVICDLDALNTLSPRELRSGRGEMAKYHFLAQENERDLLAMEQPERIACCVRIKARIVAADEREAGQRALLNYGHTLAHALEIVTGHALTHGEAVGVGLVFAARLAQRLGRIDVSRVEEHYNVVAGHYELATTLPDGVSAQHLLALMGGDKKVLDGGLTFVLDGPAGLEVVPTVPAPAVELTLAEMRP